MSQWCNFITLNWKKKKVWIKKNQIIQNLYLDQKENWVYIQCHWIFCLDLHLGIKINELFLKNLLLFIRNCKSLNHYSSTEPTDLSGKEATCASNPRAKWSHLTQWFSIYQTTRRSHKLYLATKSVEIKMWSFWLARTKAVLLYNPKRILLCLW